MAKGWIVIGSNDLNLPYDRKAKSKKDFFNLMKIKRMPTNKPKKHYEKEDEKVEE